MLERLRIAARPSLWTAAIWCCALTPAQAQQWLEEDIAFTAAEAEPGDRFGQALAVDTGTLVVGAIGDDDAGADAGAAYVFELVAGSWTQTAKLVASDGAAGDELGGAVAIQGDTVVVGARHHAEAGLHAGAAYVYTRTGSVWTEEAKLLPGDVAAGDRFGWAVAVHGDKVLVGAPQHDAAGNQSGAAWLYERAGGAWSLAQKLEPTDAQEHRRFGSAVGVRTTRLAVGAPTTPDGIHTEPGRVYTFHRTPTSWVQDQTLSAPFGDDQNGFGHALSLQEDRLAVGAPFDYNGAAFLWLRANDTWTYDARSAWVQLGQCCARYGSSLDVEGDALVAGAWNEWPAASGLSYYHERNGDWWHYRARLAASEREYDDELGRAVALEAGVTFSGAPGADDQGADSGAVYVHSTAALDISTPYCFGDGSDAPCPCGNETPPGNGDGCANAGGHGCALFVAGSASMSTNDPNFFAHSGEMSSAVLFTGTPLASGQPFGGGLLCLGPPYIRLGVRTGGLLAAWYWHQPVEEIGGWGPGDTRSFQVWYRVPPALNPCGEQFSTSNALEITFTG